MFKVNNKKSVSRVSVVNFKQVNAGWVTIFLHTIVGFSSIMSVVFQFLCRLLLC